jgi:pimeloyl-ACP methyl ester carboxylesterase
MTTTITSPDSTDQPAGRPEGGRPRMTVGLAATAAMVAGLASTLVLILVAFEGAGEPIITGSALVGLATGWALLAVLTTRFTGQPQRWARVPAVVMATTGAALVAAPPGPDGMTAASWMWPPVALVLAVWMVRAMRRAMTGRGRWLMYPTIGLLAVSAVAGGLETVAASRAPDPYPMPGALHDVGGHRLHLSCSGTGSPTVILQNGLAETSVLWSGVAAEVSRTTRVCAYDRAGQGWSDEADHPQDGLEVAADLHTLLTRAGEPGPYVLVGHSSGGTLAMTYAAEYPEQVAGMVLLDSSSPHQFTALPDFPREYAVMHRVLPVLPTLARLGAMRLIPASSSTALTPSAAAQVRSFANSPRGARNMRDEHSQLRAVFSQAQALSAFGSKPLAVVTARENADGNAGWLTAQKRMAALSTSSTHWVADTTHVGLLDDVSGSAESVRAITGVVTAVRTGTS